MLRLQNISKYYHSNDVVALGLRKVNLDFNLGEFVAVTGESGSGKSTLLNVISGLDTYEDGELFVNGEETSYYSIEEWESYRRQYIGFVFQNYNIIDSYSVLENVMVALTIQGYDAEKRKERALELIDKVGLSSHVHHKASKLSGGQKQRAVIARALAKDCPIIVADEPTGNLDSETGKNIIQLLKDISKDKLVIVVTHNFDQVKDFVTRKIRLFDGEVVEDKEIRKTDTEVEGITLATYRMTFVNLLSMALRNLVRTPRRTAFMVVIALFISLVFMFSYGSYVDRETENFYTDGGGLFTNVSDRRIVVTKFDDTAFTETELQQLASLNRVQGILEHDIILDTRATVFIQNDEYIDSYPHYINPASMLVEGDLIDGRLPQNENEVVIGRSSDYAVGDKIDITYGEQYYYDRPGGQSNISTTEVEIVGMVPNFNSNTWINNIYFHEDVITSDELLINAYLRYSGGQEITTYNLEVEADGETVSFQSWMNFVIDDSIPDGEVHLSFILLDELSFLVLDEEEGRYEDNPDFYQGMDLTIIGSTSFYTKSLTVEITDEYNKSDNDDEKYWNNDVAMNTNTFAQLLPTEAYQITLLAINSYDANIVLDQLEDLDFNAIYPSGVPANEGVRVFALITSIWFSFLLFLLMVVMYFVTYVVLRNVQEAKRKDYLIFRSIGASKKDLNKVTNIEMVYIFMFALLLVVIFFVINEYNQIWVIPQYLGYFNVVSYLVLFGSLALMAILLGRRFNKKIFSTSVITSLKQE